MNAGKLKTIKAFLPTVLGIGTVLGLLKILNLIMDGGNASSPGDTKFYLYFVPFTLLMAVIIQYLLAAPIWERFKSYPRLFGLTLLQLTGIVSIISGMIFGLIFWEPPTGMIEFGYVTLLGISAFTIYWMINLLSLKLIDRLFK